MAKSVPWITHHSHISQTETNDIFLSHKFKKYIKHKQLYEVSAIKNGTQVLKIGQKDGYLMRWLKWQVIYTHPVYSAAVSRCLSTDLIASISSGLN